MDRDQGGASANNSSDFVRKLYKMLEESEYESIVRWGDEGDSFVVVEIDEFTKNVLPRHFKHSNFASFVRQLNKYDFHKVRQNNEENASSSYGLGAWEFKHPEFQKNGKDSLDNIRRKAPAPRKTNQTVEEQFPAQQQIELLTTQLHATQQQFQLVQEKYTDLQQGHIVLLQQTVHLQKIVKGHDVAMQRVLTVLNILEASNRRLSRSGLFNTNGTANGNDEIATQENGIDDHIKTPLRQAADVLGEFPTDNLVNKELEQMTADIMLYRNLDYSTPPTDPNAMLSMHMDQVNDTGLHLDFSDMHDTDMVYPIGQTKGIDPVNKDHINNIPYSLPALNGQNGNAASEVHGPANGTGSVPQKGARASIWGFRNPVIMLVEDDRTCSRIGSKFLASFNCNPVLAKDGLEAVSKLNNSGNHGIDLILMDIIMPKLDGVSATSIIRGFDQSIPIIAMTSNIRTDDIEVYFRYGMNDVLPKPFTKEGMIRIIEKHLSPLKQAHMHEFGLDIPHDPHPGYAATAPAAQAMNMNNIPHTSASQTIKDDPTSVRSPAGSWHSPNTNAIPCPSPTSAGPPDGYNMHPLRQGTTSTGFVMGGAMPGLRSTDSPTSQNMAAPRQGIQHRRVMSDMTNGPEESSDSKRQRMYPPQQSTNNFT